MTFVNFCTSLPFSISTFAKRAIRTNLGIHPLPGSTIGFSESLTSFACQTTTIDLSVVSTERKGTIKGEKKEIKQMQNRKEKERILPNCKLLS